MTPFCDDGTEAIFFFDSTGLCKEMLYTEFEAVLDGFVGLQDFSGCDCHAAYAVINAHLEVTSVVLFKIYFDRLGNVARDWNIPFRSMVMKGMQGPDLGAGPIRLVCRSHWKDPQYKKQLWDTEQTAFGERTFELIRARVTENNFCLPQTPKQPSQVTPPSPPVLSYSAHGVAAHHTAPQGTIMAAPVPAQPVAYPQTNEPVPPVGARLPAESQVDYEQRARTVWKKMESEQRTKTARLLKSQRERVAKMKEEHALAKRALDDERSQAMEAMRTEHVNAMMSIQRDAQALRDSLEKKTTELNAVQCQSGSQQAEIERLESDAHEQMQDLNKQFSDHMESVRISVNEDIRKKLQEQQVFYEKTIADLKVQLDKEVTESRNLREQHVDLRKDKLRLLNGGADSFFKKLDDAGINFIAYHPGAGHLSIPLDDIGRYIDQPLDYAAERCGAEVDAYKAWISHTEHPRCLFDLGAGVLCGRELERVDTPKDFRPDIDNRCELHQAKLSAAGKAFKVG